MRRVVTGLFGAALALIAAPAFGQDKPDPKADSKAVELDKKIAVQIYETVKEGVELYNKGSIDECLGVYKGALMVLQGSLDYRPNTVSTIKTALTAAKAQKTAEAAFTLRKALDQAQADLSGAKKPLWDRLGGQKAVEAVVHKFVGAAAGDPKVNFLRNGKYKLDDAGVKKLEESLVAMISSATGGPLEYKGKSMKEVHKGMGITEDEFNALAGHLVATLKEFKVPQAEIDELVAIVASTKADIVEKK